MDYDEMLVNAVWAKGRPVQNYDPNIIRMDDYGNLIARFQFGNRDHQLGWEKDHIIPKANGGSDHISNLRPLNWLANVLRWPKR